MMPSLAHDDRSQGAFGRYRCAQDVRGSTTPTWQGGPLRAPVASPRLVASGDAMETPTLNQGSAINYYRHRAHRMLLKVFNWRILTCSLT